MARPEPDCSGYVTKFNVRCTDGRIIRPKAFSDNNGKRCTVVWQHLHDSIENVLGHCDLEERDDGVYGYCYFNDTENGQLAKKAVQHGDVDSFSIYANHLKQVGSEVMHGFIQEVSLVLSGANKEAKIDNIAIAHSDGSYVEDESEAVITFGDSFSHADDETVGDVFNTLSEKQQNAVYAILADIAGEYDDDEDEDDEDDDSFGHADDSDDGETIADIIDSMTDKQKNAVYAMIAEVAEEYGVDDDEEDEEVAQSDDEGEEFTVKKNVFDSAEQKTGAVLTHDQFMAINEEAKKCGSLKEAFMAHADEFPRLMHADDPLQSVKYLPEVAPGTPGIDYGVANLDLLFPEYQAVRNTPDVIKRDDEWVGRVISGTNKTPFARIKNLWFDITGDSARARGYIKGHLKKEEVVKLAKRQTGPTTIYKKQRLDRDDIIDITNFDIVAWLKSEMQMMLREELARAILIGDGRPVMTSDGKANPDKIDEECIRPIAKENELYAYPIEIDMGNTDANARYMNLIDQIFLSMADYKGSGSPTFFTTRAHHIQLRKVHDKIDRRLYNSDSELCAAMGVANIVDVPVLEGYTDDAGLPLIGIVVNLRDYTVGTNRGGQTTFFDDFDIDYNQYSYLYETRLSGALTRVDSAIIVKEIKRAPLQLVVSPATGNVLSTVPVAELQEGVTVSSTGAIDGKLYYKDEFTEFSSDPSIQSGHYLALNVENAGTDSNAKIEVNLLNGKDRQWKTFEPGDTELVVRVMDEMKQRIKLRITSADGSASEVHTFTMAGITLLDEKKAE